MANCPHNVAYSLHKRYLKETPAPQPQNLDRRLLDRIIIDLANKIREHVEPFDSENFLANKKGRLRRRYTKAYNDILNKGFDLTKDSKIDAFVKLERYFEEGKSPRMIMGRDPRFNLYYAQVIEPIEKAFFKLSQVANACDYVECGSKFSKLNDKPGYWMENDMSKFEGSQRLFALQLEYMLYSLVLPEKQKLIDMLFSTKIRKKVYTKTGVDAEFYETRGSGDMDTSLGNGCLNYIATRYFMIKNYCTSCDGLNCSSSNCRSYDFVVKGDDSYARIPCTTRHINTYAYFGFDAKILIKKHAEDVEFCSGRFVEVRPGEFVYVQKLRKMFQGLTTCINEDAIRNGWVQNYYATLGKMYSVLYKDIPVYEDIAKFLTRIGGKFGVNVHLINSYNLLSSYSAEHKDLGYVDRSLAFLSVAMVNDMDIAELNHIIQWCQTIKFNFATKYSKRCNLRSNIGEAPFGIDVDYLNTMLTSDKMCKTIKTYQRKLISFRRRFIRNNDL